MLAPLGPKFQVSYFRIEHQISPSKNLYGSFTSSDSKNLFKLHFYVTFQPHSDILDNINMLIVEILLDSLSLTLPVKSFILNDI